MTAISIIRGDTIDATVVAWVWKRDGVEVDITGYTARLTVLSPGGSTILNVLSTGSAGNRLQILTGTDGRVTPDIAKENTEDLVPGEYTYDLELTAPADGARTTIVRRGTLTVLKDNAT